MLNFEELVEIYKIKLTGILHVGAREAEEIEKYEKLLPRDKILWVEGNREKIKICKERYENIRIEEAVVLDERKIMLFNISSLDHSSSVLKFDFHSKFYPWITMVDSYYVQTKTLTEILDKHPDFEFNYISLDIQGVELKALKGLDDKYFDKIDYIVSEVNLKTLYEGCDMISEIDEFLLNKGFLRANTRIVHAFWGDAFYIRKTVLDAISI